MGTVTVKATCHWGAIQTLLWEGGSEGQPGHWARQAALLDGCASRELLEVVAAPLLVWSDRGVA